ncbi:raffinose/stachyose/melibiose transport system substrate-binding protein [Pseudarthrobacter enclensis]|uniref:Sugar ABC transporter substrate-binding protein n=1 Tax=Pseudarthrobacter enclensis TaxID=993070 RepID=A0A0V8IPX5_9MICC|nr:extracellular solute-binding protein [Pseudarthrobacter enclensis]KSU76836.1 sugar ABC transporter substrate-binding protein [Pseudarthrobacter enclensis]SCC03491.1 raffinose/stachyose/melibiose transport system substrate-binding protein [Pseudarthrobacter enclensis]
MTQHRRSSRLKAAAFAIPTIAALALTGCSASAGGSDSSGGSKEFSLSFATSNTIESPFQVLAEKYMEANPDVKITFNPQPNDSYDQTLRTQLQAGNASDIVVTSPGSGQGRSILPLAEAGFLEPLDDTAKELLPEGSAGTFGPDGRVFGQATAITVSALVTNEGAVKEAGEFPADFEALEEQCKTLESSGKSLFALAGAAPPNTGLTAMSLAASRVYAQDPKWNDKRAAKEVTFAGSEGWKSALEAVNTLKDAGCFQKGAAGAGFDAITKGLASGTALAGFIPATSWKQLQSATAGSEFGVRALPAEEGSGKDFLYASANYAFSINAASKNKEAAKAFLAWAAEPEQTKAFAEIDGALPVSGLDSYDFEGGAYKNVGDLIKDGKYGPLPNIQWPNSAVYDALATGVQGIITGQKTPDQVLQAMDAAWG